MRRCLFSIILYCITWVGSEAREYSTEGNSGANGLAQVETILFEFDAKVDFQILFGEPVINAQLKWLINPSQSVAEIPAFDSGEDPFITVPLYDLGSAAYDKVRLYNVKLQFQFSTQSGETIYLVQDVGDPAAGSGNKWSFNVPGSPDWPEVFYRSPIDKMSDARSFFSKEQAQGFFLGALKLEDVTIITAEVSFHDLHEWYAQDTPEPEVVALKKAYFAIAEGLKESFGLEVDIEKDFNKKPTYLDPLASGNRLREFQFLADHLKKQVEKFSNLPEAFKEKGDPNAYYEALAQADELVQSTQQLEFDSPDVDPEDFEVANRNIQARGTYAVKEFDGEKWIVDTANADEKVRKLDNNDRLIGTSFLFRRSELANAVCANNMAEIPFLDPRTMDVTRQVSVPCPINGNSILYISFSDPDNEGHPFISIAVRRSGFRTVKSSYTCRECGRKKKYSISRENADATSYKINPDLSVSDVSDFLWKEYKQAFCPLVLCRK